MKFVLTLVFTDLAWGVGEGASDFHHRTPFWDSFVHGLKVGLWLVGLELIFWPLWNAVGGS